MEFIVVTTERFVDLQELQIAYKNEIGEEAPSQSDLESLKEAIDKGKITFYGCLCEEKLVACCSICFTYSTFNYGETGIFEDFYIKSEYRHKGIARKLVAYAYEESRASALSVGCADCDIQMYNAIGFSIPLGNMLAFEPKGK